MSGDVHVRFREHLRVRFPRVTQKHTLFLCPDDPVFCYLLPMALPFGWKRQNYCNESDILDIGIRVW